jgi:hypothetical protein
MAKYVIESPHTPEECLQALDETLAKSPDTLNKFVWGCAHGDHTGYAYIESANEKEASSIIPDFLQIKAVITEVDKLSPEQVRAFHKE